PGPAPGSSARLGTQLALCDYDPGRSRAGQAAEYLGRLRGDGRDRGSASRLGNRTRSLYPRNAEAGPRDRRMTGERLLLDTVFAQALLNTRDQYHAKALAVVPRFRNSDVWVTEAVLIEIGDGLSALDRRAAVQFIRQ